MFSLAQNYLTRGFWGDEAWTSLISQLPYVQMLKTTAADFHPPGYYTIIQLWYTVFPATEVSTRIVSVIFYLLTGFVVYKLVSLISGPIDPTSEVSLVTKGDNSSTSEVNNKHRVWGLIAAGVVLLNPIFFTYAFEARNYTMFAFMATGSMWTLLKLVLSFGHRVSESDGSLKSEYRNPLFDSKLAQSEQSETNSNVQNSKSKTVLNLGHLNFGIVSYFVLRISNLFQSDNWKGWFILYILFSTLGIYTHYYMFFTLAAQGIFVLLWHHQSTPGVILKMIGAWIVVAVLYLPWMPFLLKQLGSVGQSYWIGGIDARTHYEAILRILAGEHDNLFRFWLFGLSVILIFSGLIRTLFRTGGFGVLIWLWVLVPFVLATLPGLRVDGLQLPFRPIFFWRYLIPAAVPLGILMLQPLRTLKSPLKALIVVVLIGLSLAIDYLSFIRYPATFKQIYEGDVVPQIRQDDKIVTVLPSFAEVLYYRNYFGLDNDLIVLPEGLVQFSGKSLLDAYEKMGVVKIADRPQSGYFELRPGPSVRRTE